MDERRDLSAMLLRIEKSSVHDGEGLRTVVFLKGCNLRCLWCSTPESQQMEAELAFDAARCRDCGVCGNNCRNLELGRSGRVVRERELCRHCWRCRDICPQQALFYYGREAGLAEVFDEVLKDEIFYFHSGGGMEVEYQIGRAHV